MTEFSPSVLQSAVEELRRGLGSLDDQIARIDTALGEALRQWWVTSWIADRLRWCAERLRELGTSAADAIRELLEGAAAPVLLWGRARDWTRQVESPASIVAAGVAPEALRAPSSWSGAAATAYVSAVRGQPAAATQIQRVGTAVSTSLTVCATAGCAFYLALGWIVAKLVGSLAVAVVALGSAVFSWAGLALVVEEAGVTAALVSAAVAALVATQTTAATSVVEITRAAGSGTGFPQGSWPRGTA